ncbi:hypothetical protein SAMN05421741_11362 [Paenimyroides ummariense]|uniref:Uncharacterized protein n=1 Tax=Paenimyroides ummariense TaxID=913024 RepID=A0A1I5CU09_9FLAO|nr:hypothetical protein [Paenimyroides ummariense]SFN90475.1 hypothetical protein SAMN05421741_11362 [Paenimyroides ummariense]
MEYLQSRKYFTQYITFDLQRKKSTKNKQNTYNLYINPIATSLFNCEAENCFTPPEPTVFEFENDDGDNLIARGILTKGKIVIQQNLGNENRLGINVHITKDNKAQLENVSWFDGTRNDTAYIILYSLKTFNFTVTSSKIKNNCSGY